MIIFGIDIGFASLGWAVRDYDPRGRTIGTVLAAGVIQTAGDDGPRGEDDVRRMNEIAQALVLLTSDATGDYPCPHLIAYERPIGAQGARAAHTLGLAHGLVRGLFFDEPDGTAPLIDVTPREVKLALAGDSGADKEAMIRACADRHWPQIRALKTEHQEHAADAIGVTIAAIQSEAFMRQVHEVARGVFR